MEPFSLRATVQAAIDAQNGTAGNKIITIESDIQNEVSDALNGPSLYVYEVFSILLDNATKFSSEGNIRISIKEQSLGREESRFYCCVSDQGIGVPEKFREKIFDPFVQIDSSDTRKYGGIGLGLAIAKRMVELMGGTISVESNNDKGSTFKFSFNCNLQGSTKYSGGYSTNRDLSIVAHVPLTV
jgi:signal transduction histidine kinase